MKRIIILVFVLFISACAKTASETATDALLHQADAIHQQIKKECPASNFDTSIAALKATIENQLSSCKAEKAQLKEKNNTLLAILLGLIAVIVAVNYGKIKQRWFK